MLVIIASQQIHIKHTSSYLYKTRINVFRLYLEAELDPRDKALDTLKWLKVYQEVPHFLVTAASLSRVEFNTLVSWCLHSLHEIQKHTQHTKVCSIPKQNKKGQLLKWSSRIHQDSFINGKDIYIYNFFFPLWRYISR